MLANRMMMSGGQFFPLYAAITQLGLTTNLQMVLDAGDSASYLGSGQTVTDLSGAGSHFYLGMDASPTTTDPTFANGHFAFDGGDILRAQSTHAWANSFHKDGAVFSLFLIAEITGSGALFSTRAPSVGGFMMLRSTDKLRLAALTSVTTPMAVNSDSNIPSGLHAFWCSITENGGNVSFMGIDGAVALVSGSGTFNAAYSSPSSSNTNVLGLGSGFDVATTGVADSMPSGSKIVAAAAWQGTAVSSADLISLYNLLAGRI